MTNYGFKGGVLAIGEESAFGTAVARTKFIEFNSESFNVDEGRIHSKALPRVYTDDSEVALGAVKVAGDIEIEMRYEGAELLFKHALGSVSSAETASFVIAASNCKLDFDIGAGALVATIASSTYAAGTNQLTAGSLCKAIFDAIVAAEATGTYTVSFSTATKLFTITRSAGTFNILWNTGANKANGIAATIGYSTAADDTGALTYTSDTAVVPVFTHTFTLADELPTGLTLEIDADAQSKLVEGGKITAMTLSLDANGFLIMKLSIAGEDITISTVTSATLPTAAFVVFNQGVIQYGGSPVSVKKFELNLNNSLDVDRRFIGSKLIAEPLRKSKYEVTGSFTLDFDSVNQYNDFRAATSRAMTLTFTGATIKGAITYSITITLPIVKLTDAVPKISEAGVLPLDLSFKAYATDTSTREMTIAIQNTLVSVP